MQRFPEWIQAGFSAEIDDALEKIKVQMPHLIFSDWSIKGGNAFQILDFIKEVKNYHPYIIFFTGFQSEHPEIPENMHNRYPWVNKYLRKPIYENLTENLSQYLDEARQQHTSFFQNRPVFIENELRQQVRIFPGDSVAIFQSEEDPRRKILHLKNREKIYLRQSWKDIYQFCQINYIDYFVCHNRKIIINKSYISKYSKPFIWLENGMQIKVSRDRWEEFL